MDDRTLPSWKEELSPVQPGSSEDPVPVSESPLMDAVLQQGLAADALRPVILNELRSIWHRTVTLAGSAPGLRMDSCLIGLSHSNIVYA